MGMKIKNSDLSAVFVFSSIAISYVPFPLALNRLNEMTRGKLFEEPSKQPGAFLFRRLSSSLTQRLQTVVS